MSQDPREARYDDRNIVALCGGVGGAKLALGLQRVLREEKLLIVTNTGDDFTHLGLRICPDLDTVCYTLSGLANPETGWGRRDESWNFMKSLGMIGGEDWFQLGDKDLATHVERTRRLAAGESLSEVTADLAAQMGVGAKIAPMSDESIATVVETPDGPLAFQHYFVREKCEPQVRGVRYQGAEMAKPSPAFEAALADRSVDAFIICPSNPFLSVDPILALPGVRQALMDHPAPVIAVSPIVGGRAIKGPTAKMMEEMGVDVSALGVARHYGSLLDGFVIDETDAVAALKTEKEGFRTMVAPTVMRKLEEKAWLAQLCIKFAADLTEEAGGKYRR
ncbi:MAG: 2-phospho-L-lactate transferase [Alphaproteobacteria bacterium]|nr:2-phospho-L-lactate transferase [Alphaproteobacteria bacterium]